MKVNPVAPIYRSNSTWQQPVPASASATRAELIDAVARRCAQLTDGRCRIAVDGRTASGKTSLAEELAVAIAESGRPVLRATLDDFKRPWRDRHLYDRESGEGYYRNAFDYSKLREILIDPFGAGAPCALCSIDPATQIDHSQELVTPPGDAVLLVDGVFAFRRELKCCWDFRIWLEVKPEVSVSRGHTRDGGDISIVRDRYQISEDIYIAEEAPAEQAEVVVDNSDFSKPRVIV